MNDVDDEMEDSKRPEYMVTKAYLMKSAPGNFDHANGEPAAIVTIGRKSSIEPLAFNMADTRKLALALLVTLATYEDLFARKLLDENFPTKDSGEFKWPHEPPEQ